MPEVLGLSEPDFIWVTNAGNVVTGPLSSTVRSLALACGVHDGKEIAISVTPTAVSFSPCGSSSKDG